MEFPAAQGRDSVTPAAAIAGPSNSKAEFPQTPSGVLVLQVSPWLQSEVAWQPTTQNPDPPQTVSVTAPHVA